MPEFYLLNMAKILLVEDDSALAHSICDWLGKERHTVEWVQDGQEAADRLRLYQYDLIVLDLNIPKIKGLDVLQQFRSGGGATPILILTGQSDIDTKERGLDTGADDFLPKPFDGRELNARLRALLRRFKEITPSSLQFADLFLDRASCFFKRGEREIALVPKEFDLLEFLMRSPNRIYSPQQLLDHVWNSESDATVDAITTCVKRLRKKIDVPGKTSYIRTIYGAGYRLSVPQDEQEAPS